MNNFTGVTFAQQKVLPSDDAIIRRASLSDGVLYGCEMSYSGSTLTMGSGQLLICGRQIRHPAAENLAIVDATSGFARLVLTVDLTKTSSKDSFEQVVDSIEYAASQDGFLELVQENINVSGTRYQVVACVVSLGTGGITGIVDQIGAVEASGGGGLNFSVVGGLTQPANPKENTIWVETDVPITIWTFSAAEPTEPVDGMVWIIAGKASTVEFNALKKNGIQVYPISASQYVSGAWVDVIAKSYQNGEWVDWWDGVLYNAGDTYDSYTGGYSGVGNFNSATNSGGKLYLDVKSNASAALITEKAIALNGFKNLKITGNGSNAANCFFGIASDRSANFISTVAMGSQNTYTLDISSVNDSFYVGIMGRNGNKVSVDKIWLER